MKESKLNNILIPILMVFLRPALAIIFQTCLIIILILIGNNNPVFSSTPWWTVYGTLIDIVCLIVLFSIIKKEKIKLFSLFNYQKSKLKNDIILGIGVLLFVFPIVMFFGSCVASLIIYGKLQPILPEGAFIRYLPLWAVIFSRSIWWIIWSFTEESVFQGYALPRLKKIFNNNILAILFVGFGWALQHSFLPFITVSHSLWLFLSFLPLTIILQIIYLKTGRLTPLIIAHWGMDLFSVLFLVRVI